jgi:hypothetical protein
MALALEVREEHLTQLVYTIRFGIHRITSIFVIARSASDVAISSVYFLIRKIKTRP